jgi:hypothetical protein
MRTGKIEIGPNQRRVSQGGEDTPFAGRFTGDRLTEGCSNPLGFVHGLLAYFELHPDTYHEYWHLA